MFDDCRERAERPGSEDKDGDSAAYSRHEGYSVSERVFGLAYLTDVCSGYRPEGVDSVAQMIIGSEVRPG